MTQTIASYYQKDGKVQDGKVYVDTNTFGNWRIAHSITFKGSDTYQIDCFNGDSIECPGYINVRTEKPK